MGGGLDLRVVSGKVNGAFVCVCACAPVCVRVRVRVCAFVFRGWGRKGYPPELLNTRCEFLHMVRFCVCVYGELLCT